MRNSPGFKFLAAAIIGLLLLILLGLAFIRLTDPTRETINTAPPENEVRQPRAPEPATSAAPRAPSNAEPPAIFATETKPPDTGNSP